VGNGGPVEARRDQPRRVRDVRHVQRADAIGDGGQPLEIHLAWIRARPAHDHLRPVLAGEPLDLVVTTSGVYQAADGSRVWNSGGAWPITEKLLLKGTSGGFTTYDLLDGTKSEKELAWNKRGCTLLRASSTMLTTRYLGNASYVDLATGEFTSIWNVRAACSNNLFPANGVLNIPNLSGGCTCNYMPISQAFVPTSVLE